MDTQYYDELGVQNVYCAESIDLSHSGENIVR